MRLHFSPTTQAALLLVGLAVLQAGLGRLPARPAPAPEPAARAAALLPGERQALQRCREDVAIIHDVHWAAACMANPDDDSAECTLPDDRAAALNFARAAAEERCVKETVRVARSAGPSGPPHQ